MMSHKKKITHIPHEYLPCAKFQFFPWSGFEIRRSNFFSVFPNMAVPDVSLMVRVVGLGSSGPEFKSLSTVELIPGGDDSACHISEVGKTSTSLLG